jgi:hypothetical protein
LNLLEYLPQPHPFYRINHLQKPYPSLQVLAKPRTSLAILPLRTLPDTVGQHSLQPIKVAPHYICLLVGHQAGEMLAHSLPHDSSLTMMHNEAFFPQN